MNPDSSKPTWLITGCSSGFGRELAKAVLERGWQLVATARDPASIADIVAGHEDRAVALRLDVTDRAQIAAAVQQAESRFGAIDVLVNNAGQGFLAGVEEAIEADVRAMFDLNYFGLVAMTVAALPGMRRRRRGAIVNITSVGGLVGRAGSGYYASSKFAVEGLSEALAQEVAPLGIRVIVVEPGPYRTRFLDAARSSGTAIADYESTVGERLRMMRESNGKQPGDPARAALAIVQAVESPQPPLHLVLGAPGMSNVRDKLRRLQQDMDAWEQVSRGTDYRAAAR